MKKKKINLKLNFRKLKKKKKIKKIFHFKLFVNTSNQK